MGKHNKERHNEDAQSKAAHSDAPKAVESSQTQKKN